MSEISKPELKRIPLDQIARSTKKLREVDREGQQYIGVRDSVAARGVLDSISVRATPDGEKPYELMNGLHRYTASLELGIPDIPCQIFYGYEEKDVLETQIISNLHVVKTSPTQFSKQIHRLLALDDSITINQLANDLNVSPTYISERMNLIKLDEKIAALVDDGKITLTNAYSLARLPIDEQPNYVQAAMNETPEEFSVKARMRLKEIKESERSGNKAGAREFSPIPKMRKKAEVVNEFNKPTLIPALIKQLKITDPVQAAVTAVQWTMQMDPVSVQAQKAKYEQSQKEVEEAKRRRAAEKAKKMAEAAAKAQAELEESE